MAGYAVTQCTTATPCQSTDIVWRDHGAPAQFAGIVLVLLLFLVFWYWVVHYTYDQPKFKPRRHDWEDQ